VFLYSIILAWIFWLLLLLEVLDAAGCCTAGAGFFFFQIMLDVYDNLLLVTNVYVCYCKLF